MEAKQSLLKSHNILSIPQAKGGEKEKHIVCYHCGSRNYSKNGLNKSSGTQIYTCKVCGKSFTPVQSAKTEFIVNPQAEYELDVWDIRRLGIKDDIGRTSYKLNFSLISQPWFREAAKIHAKTSLPRLAIGSVQEALYSLRLLSRFFAEHYPGIQPSEITPEVMSTFAAYINAKGLAAATRSKVIGSAKTFFEACYQNEWIDVRRYIVRQEHFPKLPKAAPRYIPEQVLRQLNEHLDDLAEPIARMVLVIQECGMRISELVHLKLDCLLQDKAGDWFLRYYQFKMKKEVTIPISREVVRVIQEQQRYIREYLPSGFEYLFCANQGVRAPKFNPSPRIMLRKTLPDHLNRLAEKYDICDENGMRWHFQTHQFRHTVGTRMINNGVPQHIIQRYLGHESPEMTSRYAAIHDQTMKQEIAKYQGKVVNIAGQLVEANDIEADDEDLQWFKKNINAQALPNGSCALPTISKGCPHANACLTCTHFRTSAEHLEIHRQELKRTRQLIDKAQSNGWQRQVEMNEQVRQNLENIIATLEDACHES